MSELSALAVAKLHSLGHAAMAVPRESRLKLAFVSSGIVGLWVVTLVVAWRSFRFVDRYGAELLGGAPVSIVELLVPRLVGVFAFFLLVMLTFSSALLAHATLFRSREMAFLLATPASVRAIALSRFAEIVLLASWATAYLGSPVLLAYGAVRAAPWPFYAWAVMAFVPFVVIPASLGTLVALLAARLVPRLPRWVLLAIGGGCLAAVFLLFQGRVRGVLVLGEVEGADEVKYLHGQFGRGTFTFLGGHDPEDFQHRVGDPATDLSKFKHSPGYRLILNNVLFPAAQKKKQKTWKARPDDRSDPKAPRIWL